MATRKTRVLVLGGGFGGVYAARRLERLLGRDTSVELTLVSRDNFFLFTPMLHEVAASDLDITHIVSPLRQLLRRTTIVVGDVEAIDPAARRVTIRHGFERHDHVLDYDHLVVALGSTTNFYGLPGLESHALTMKTLGDAIHLRNRVVATLEEASTECAGSASGLLTFVVAGGGFAGVETMAAIGDFVHEALRYYPGIDRSRVRLVLVHGGELILPELGPDLGAYAQRNLQERGFEVLTTSRVAGVDAEGVTLTDGRRIASRLVVWTAGTAPHQVLGTLPCALQNGRIIVDETLAVPDWPGLWALGDCAVVPDSRTGKPYPPTAQHAIRQATVVAGNIAATLKGLPRRPFRFTTLGQLAAIGRRTGVARVLGVKFSGFFAWWLWRTIYLGKLPRLEKKVRVAIDWTLDLVFAKDLVQFLTVRAPVQSTAPRVADLEPLYSTTSIGERP